MSGGSFDYTCHDVDEGRLDKLLRYAPHFIKSLRELEQRVPAEFKSAVHEARFALDDLNTDLQDLSERVKKWSKILHAVEWWESSDMTLEQAGEDIKESMNSSK